MSGRKKISARRRYSPIAITAVAALAVGGAFYPLLGLAVPALMVAALVMNFRGRRSFCAKACPNGMFLSAALKPISRNRRVSALFIDRHFRQLLCGVMLFCMIGLGMRGYPDFAAIGRSFWVIYLIAVSAGVLFGLLYKPRAWCTFCPLGTLQDTVKGASG